LGDVEVRVFPHELDHIEDRGDVVNVVVDDEFGDLRFSTTTLITAFAFFDKIYDFSKHNS